MLLSRVRMFHENEMTTESGRNAWLPNETGSYPLHPYSYGDLVFSDKNTLTESLERLEDNARKLRLELSHHSDLVEALSSHSESFFVSEVKQSVACLENRIEKIEDAIPVVLRHASSDLTPRKTSGSNDPLLTIDKKSRFSPVSTRRRIHSLNNLLKVDELPLITLPKRSRSSSSVSSPSSRIESEFPSYRSGGVLVQSWLIKRIQSEITKRHRAEALLTQHQLELERLQATENLLRQQISSYENKLQTVNTASNQPCPVDRHKLDTVQKYLFDSVHIDQLPVTEFPNFRESDTAVILDSFIGNGVKPRPEMAHVESKLRGCVQYPDHYVNDESSHTYSPQHCSASPSNLFRRHFSEPDLVISCFRKAPAQHSDAHVFGDSRSPVTFTTSTPQLASSAKHSSPEQSFSSSVIGKRCGYLSKRERLSHLWKNSRLDAESLIDGTSSVPVQQLILFLRRSSVLMRWLTDFQRRDFTRGVHYNRKFFDSVFKFGEALERFREFVLGTIERQTDPGALKTSALLPTRLCQLLRQSMVADQNPQEEGVRLFSSKQRRVSSSLEQMTLIDDQGMCGRLMSHVWQRVDPGLLSSEDCCFKESLIETLATRLNVTRQKLQQQVEQCNDLEALLAERDARIIAQANELAEVEAHLAASSQTVTTLHKQLISGQHNWTKMLQQIQSHDTSVTSQQLPAVPAVLDLVVSLDAAYADLQESERCRLLAERRASSAQATARRLRLQLRSSSSNITAAPDPLTSVSDLMKPEELLLLLRREDCSTQTESSQLGGLDRPSATENHGARKTVLREVSVQSCDPSEENRSLPSEHKGVSLEEILRFGLSRPQVALDSSHSRSDAEQIAELREALRNAVAQVDRLQKYRTTQKTRFEQLQQRFSQMSCELDATVDALRHHQTSSEIERRRSAVELSQLRTQLAKATSSMEQYKLMQAKMTASFSPTSMDRNLPAMRAASASPVSLRSSTTAKDRPDILLAANSNDLAMELRMAQSELAQLRSDMIEQKATADRELTNLRGQLAEATADARSLRLQVTRLNSINSLNGRSDISTTSSGNSDLPCANCGRLQRLLDLLQAKYHRNTPGLIGDAIEATDDLNASRRSSAVIAVSASLDASCQVNLSPELIGSNAPTEGTELVAGENPQLLRQHQTLMELEEALKNKELALQKENGRLSVEADRLKRRQDALLAGEARLKKDVEAHESQMESRRVELQNEMLHVGRERARLTEERKAIELERDHLQALQAELKRKRMQAELLIELATRENQVNNTTIPPLPKPTGSVAAAAALSTNCSPAQQITGVPPIGSGKPHHLVHSSTLASSSEQATSAAQHVNKDSAVQTDAFMSLSEDLQSATSCWFDWLETCLDQMGISDPVESTGLQTDTRTASAAIEILKKELDNLRARWNVECGLHGYPDGSIAQPAQIVSDSRTTASVAQLLKRLRSAEQEAQDASEQLKASNAEFLTLRERLSHATIERAHLKATVEGLDEQVSQLESSLLERTEQLNACRTELAHYTQRVRIPLPTLWPAAVPEIRDQSKTAIASDKLHCALPEATIVTVGPALNNYADVKARLHHCGFILSQQLARVRHRTWECAIRVRPIWHRISTMRSRCRLQSQPRPSLFFGLLVYFILVHFFLLRCWLS